MLLADFIAENWFLQISLFEFTIVASGGYMRAFQMSNLKKQKLFWASLDQWNGIRWGTRQIFDFGFFETP